MNYNIEKCCMSVLFDYLWELNNTKPWNEEALTKTDAIIQFNISSVTEIRHYYCVLNSIDTTIIITMDISSATKQFYVNVSIY